MNGFITQIDAGMGFTGEVQASTLWAPEEWFFNALAFGKSDSGERVNPNTALGHGPVWQAINILAGDVGQLPWHKMKWTEEDGKYYQERDEDHPLDWLLSYQPNRFQTPSVWRETMMGWALGWGNGISAIVRNKDGERELLPLLPDRTDYVQDEEFGYMVVTRLANGKRAALKPDEVFHVRGLTSNGFWGLSAVEVCKNVVGHGLALQRHGNSTFKNGAQLGGVLTSEGSMPSPEVRAAFRNEWEKLHAGADNAARVAMLYGGMKFQSVSMSNTDAQWLDARRLDREMVASLFGLPAFKLNALENSAVRSNLEEQNKDYFNTSLARWLNRFNEEAERKLLSMRERRSKEHSFMWRVEAFLQGNTKQLIEGLGLGVVNEIMTRNEARERLGLNPVDSEMADDLRNPAINPASTPAEPPSGDAPTEPDSDTQEANGGSAGEAKNLAKQLLASRAEALLEAEAQAVTKAVAPGPKKARNVTKWAENYYDNYLKTAENFLDLPCKMAISAGFFDANWRTAAGNHARSNLNLLNSLTGLCGSDSLQEISDQMSTSIRKQGEQFTAAILGEHENG